MTKRRAPACRRICGRPPGYPNESGSQPMSVPSTPSSRSKNSPPSTSWRMRDSPLGMFVSDSTHMPPTGRNRPCSTYGRMRAKRSGASSLSHASCCADDIVKRNCGSVSSRCSTFAIVRATLRRVSRNGQSHAESMCEWPMALMRWPCGEAGESTALASTARARPTVDRRSGRCRARRGCARSRTAGPRPGSSRAAARLPAAGRPRGRRTARRPPGRGGRARTPSNRYWGSSPAVAGSPSRVGRNATGMPCGDTGSTTGLAAASMSTSIAPRSSSTGSAGIQRDAGCTPFTRRPSGV